jgi:polyisoprenoid-binding protein YceI
MKSRLALTAAVLALAACSPRPAEQAKAPADKAAAPAAAHPAPTDAPAGVYTLDPSHTSVTFRVSHLGLSHYTARFAKMAGELQYDPANPAAQSVTATIDATSLKTDYPEPEKLDFDTQVERDFLEATKFPQITFKSTKVEVTGPKTANVTGDFTLHGVTKPVVLQVTWNGGYKPFAMDPGGRVGFSARTTIKRSDFGITTGLPAPGSYMGVFDDVDVQIEAEFMGKAPAAPAT